MLICALLSTTSLCTIITLWNYWYIFPSLLSFWLPPSPVLVPQYCGEKKNLPLLLALVSYSYQHLLTWCWWFSCNYRVEQGVSFSRCLSGSLNFVQGFSLLALSLLFRAGAKARGFVNRNVDWPQILTCPARLSSAWPAKHFAAMFCSFQNGWNGHLYWFTH